LVVRKKQITEDGSYSLGEYTYACIYLINNSRELLFQQSFIHLQTNMSIHCAERNCSKRHRPYILYSRYALVSQNGRISLGHKLCTMQDTIYRQIHQLCLIVKKWTKKTCRLAWTLDGSGLN